MANLSITAANVLPSSQAILNKANNFGTTVTQGQVVYLDSNNLWQLAKANGSATQAKAQGIAVNAGSPGQPAVVALSDPAFTPGGTMTLGLIYTTSETAGAIGVSSDLTNTGDIPCVLMIPLAGSTTQANLMPLFGGSVHA
jgi:hypothetical protein